MLAFRPDDDTVAKLDAVQAHYSTATGLPLTKADTLRKLIHDAAKKIPKKLAKGG
jgi:hypothetical protein